MVTCLKELYIHDCQYGSYQSNKSTLKTNMIISMISGHFLFILSSKSLTPHFFTHYIPIILFHLFLTHFIPCFPLYLTSIFLTPFNSLPPFKPLYLTPPLFTPYIPHYYFFTTYIIHPKSLSCHNISLERSCTYLLCISNPECYMGEVQKSSRFWLK